MCHSNFEVDSTWTNCNTTHHNAMSKSSPFASSSSLPGHGSIILSILPGSIPVLEILSFQYPLKLIAPSALKLPSHDKATLSSLIHTVYLLTYGGGLVAGDSIDLLVSLAAETRLILLTQGSTKIFKSPARTVLTTQTTIFEISNHAALCYLPDPVQPFGDSMFEQKQIYNFTGRQANLCICDWVSEGRTARGEKWSFRAYTSRNEFWLRQEEAKKRLLLRDNMILDGDAVAGDAVATRMKDLGVYGTLILCGDMFRTLGRYFMHEFKQLPQIGSRQWDVPDALTPEQTKRAKRVEQEKKDGVLWTAASLRGFVVVKFGAKEVEGAKRWLRDMLRSDGTVEREFGERALLCLR
jgi:urease accessory protein